MKKYSWIILFLVVVAVYIAGIELPNQLLQNICKPLLMPLLMFYFISQTKNITSNLKTGIIGALFFSWAGDILLMFQEKQSIFFLMGLSSFLLAHLFYIWFFSKIKRIEKIGNKPVVIAIGALYAAFMIKFLSPYLGDMRWPVYIYAAVITTMFIMAMHLLFIKNKTIGIWIMAGAILFVASDSLLAVNKFYQPFELAGMAITLTYVFAQLFITEGAIRYIRLSNSN